MNMFDEARVIRGMIEMCNMTQGEIAKKLGVSQSYVANKLRLLNFPENIEKQIIESGLTERHARALLRLEGEEVLSECIERVRERGLTVAECEAMVDIYAEARAPKMIGLLEKHRRIERFEDFISSGVESISSLGIEARRTTEYHGGKKYIMITIDEG